MPKTKQSSKRTRRKEAVPVLGLVGVSLSLAGGASVANAAAVADTPSQDKVPLPGREITLNEEEIADVSLATFYVFDKENVGTPRLQLARGCRCGGCGRGCHGCRGCHRGCGCGGCGCGGCACCWWWGYCRVC